MPQKAIARGRKPAAPALSVGFSHAHVFRGNFDDEGVYFYQAYNDTIADWAVDHQTLGGPGFDARRMTWIKPSFAWMLYRAGYGRKDKNQTRILKVKLGHAAVAEILSKCACGHGRGGTLGRVQWDPERDILTTEGGTQPAKMPATRAIQIGMRNELSEFYCGSILSVEDVTELAHRAGNAHADLTKDPNSEVMRQLLLDLPDERPYMPHMEQDALVNLQLIPSAEE
jgi:hypothetical protein